MPSRDNWSALASMTSNKHRNRRESSDSKTGVHRREKHGVGIWNNPRVTWTIRVDEGIKNAFIPWAKRVFGSTCLPIESFCAGLMSAHVKAEELGVHLGRTVAIDVDTINIQRSLRSRRKFEVDACGYRGCNEPAVAYGIWRRSKTLPLCRSHLSIAEGKPDVWKIVSDECSTGKPRSNDSKESVVMDFPDELSDKVLQNMKKTSHRSDKKPRANS